VLSHRLAELQQWRQETILVIRKAFSFDDMDEEGRVQIPIGPLHSPLSFEFRHDAERDHYKLVLLWEKRLLSSDLSPQLFLDGSPMTQVASREDTKSEHDFCVERVDEAGDEIIVAVFHRGFNPYCRVEYRFCLEATRGPSPNGDSFGIFGTNFSITATPDASTKSVLLSMRQGTGRSGDVVSTSEYDSLRKYGLTLVDILQGKIVEFLAQFCLERSKIEW